MRFSDAKGRKVVDKGTASTVGQVRGFLVDPASRSVVALRLKKTDRGEALRWADLTAFGVDAVTIGDPAAITDLDSELTQLSDKRRSLLKKRVLTSGGDEVGHVLDIDFDANTGALTTILLQEGGEISADRLIGVGPYAVVVQETHSEA